MHACETIYLCMCVRLYIFVCVRLHLCMCVRLPFATSRWTYCNIFGLLLKHIKQALNTLWNEKITKIKVRDLDELYNFYIHHLYSWNHLVVENQVWSCHFLKFKIWTIQILSNKKMTKIKVVDSDVFNNFYIHHIYSWNHLLVENQVWSYHFLKFKI